MRQSIVNFAKKVYLNTPYQSLRSVYYQAFCAIVRDRIVQASIDGINYELNLGETIDVGIYLNRYELDVAGAIEKICQPGFTVLDIGANIGAHAFHLAKIVGEFGKVYAFEPTDYAYQKLERNISLNHFSNIIPVQVALSDENRLRQSIHFKSSWPTKGEPVSQESIVDFVRLDDWCQSENIEQIDLIKLDVDGNEYSVILGAESLLTKQRPIIIMEVWGLNFLNDLENPFVLLKKIGYRFFHIDTGKEYVSIDDLKDAVSLDGKLLDCSFNMIATR